MGWAAYRFKRTKGDTSLGEITVIVPKMSEQITISSGYKSTSELLAYSDFPVEAHVFTVTSGVQKLRAFGFGNIIDVTLYAGEKWSLDNGSYIEFSSYESQYDRQQMYFSVPGKFLGNEYVNSYTAAWTRRGIYGENGEGTYPRFFMGSSGTNYGKISFDNQGRDTKIPTTIVTEHFFFKDVKPIYITDDPYGDGGETEIGGGEGDFDNTSDPVDIPGLPTLSATSAGFITLFNPSVDELSNLASYMWSDLFDINGWKKVFADPMQAILGLSIVPVSIPSAGTRPVKVGNISTDVAMTVATSQYVAVDCGTLNVNEFWGAYLDYDPFTKAEIYLPYIGIHSLATDDIMGKAIHVIYHVDILSGSCCAYVKCGGSVLYSFVGQCSSSVPITGDNWTNVINGALSIAGSIGSMVATGGASAPSAIGNIASTAVNSMKPSIEKSGSMGGTGGMLGVQTPYLILTRPRQAVPRDQNKYIGYPSFITAKLSDLSGYTEIDSIHLENIGATEKELSEIENILKSGVIF